jgi:hypothetical protein
MPRSSSVIAAFNTSPMLSIERSLATAVASSALLSCLGSSTCSLRCTVTATCSGSPMAARVLRRQRAVREVKRKALSAILMPSVSGLQFSGSVQLLCRVLLKDPAPALNPLIKRKPIAHIRFDAVSTFVHSAWESGSRRFSRSTPSLTLPRPASSTRGDTPPSLLLQHAEPRPTLPFRVTRA